MGINAGTQSTSPGIRILGLGIWGLLTVRASSLVLKICDRIYMVSPRETVYLPMKPSGQEEGILGFVCTLNIPPLNYLCSL
jgi:hypothetical protein